MQKTTTEILLLKNKKMVIWSVSIPVFLGCLAFIGWFFGIELLASVRNIYIPMARDTAFIFVLFGLILMIHTLKPFKGWIKKIIIALVVFASIYGMLKFVGYLISFDLTFEDIWLPAINESALWPIKRMSPATGLLFSLSGIALFFILIKINSKLRKNIASVLGTITLVLGFIAVTGYIFDSPFLYGSDVIPLAATTALAFLFLGLGLITSIPDGFVFRFFSINTVRKQLLKIFLPVLTVTIFAVTLLTKIIVSITDINLALFTSIIYLISLLFTTSLILYLSKNLSQKIEKRNAELRESKKQFERAIDGAPIPVMLHAEDGEVIKISEPWSTFTGYTQSDIPTTEIWAKKAYGSKQDDLNSIIDSLYYIKKRQHGGKRKVTIKDGSTLIWDFYSAYIGKLNDGRRMVMSVAIDITEQSRLVEERLLMESQLRNQQKLESIGTLASGVAHEINNPINGILNYGQIILDSESADNNIKEYASEIIAETNRVSEIVKNLLEFSRQNNAHHSYANIEDIISKTLSLINTVIKKDQIELNFNIEENIPPIKCRSQQIQQVLMNLFTNARDALNDKYEGYDENKKINLKCTQYVLKEQKWIKLTIEDFGAGISNDKIDKIFDPFFTTKERTKGTGLGLSISYGIIKEHHGEITVKSKVGFFTRFTIKLPCDNGWENN